MPARKTTAGEPAEPEAKPTPKKKRGVLVIPAIRLPEKLPGNVKPEAVAFYATVGALAAIEIVEWPVAILLSTGHYLVHRHHNKLEEAIGEALEEA